MYRFLLVVAGIVGFALLGVSAAQAQSCLRLKAELAHLQARGGGSSAERARYERAFREQAAVLARTETQARNAGCFSGGFLFLRRQPEPICRSLIPKLRQMEENLALLDRRRRQGDDDTAYRINELHSLIAARGCDRGGEPWQDAQGQPYGLDPALMLGGTFRTLCVRTCDGYYFPISYSTTSAQFGQDARTCASMCPGAESRLYYYANPGGTPEEMFSIEGAPYSALPTAFQYRESFSPSCSCTPPGGYSTVAANPTAAEAEPEEDTARLPNPRPAPGEDPETLANRAGNYVPGETPAATASAGAPGATGGRSVRIVGPAYLTGPEQDAVVLQKPVPN